MNTCYTRYCYYCISPVYFLLFEYCNSIWGFMMMMTINHYKWFFLNIYRDTVVKNDFWRFLKRPWAACYKGTSLHAFKQVHKNDTTRFTNECTKNVNDANWISGCKQTCVCLLFCSKWWMVCCFKETSKINTEGHNEKI